MHGQSATIILCHRSHLESRCIERGYTLEEVMPCVLSKDGDQWLVDVSHPQYPRPSGLTDETPPPMIHEHGPGTELKRLLAGWPFYITASPDCSCNHVAREMDAWGADECEQPERMDYILAALRDNAAKRGLPFLDAAGRMLVRRAIKNARREASRVETQTAAASEEAGDNTPSGA